MTYRSGATGERGRQVAGILARVIDAVYPPRCMACTALTDAPSGLCGRCWAETTFHAGQVCDLCGVTVPTGGDAGLMVCEGCNRNPPAWDRGRGAVAYEGTGRRLVLSLKHGDRLDTAPTLAGWMLNAGRDLIGPSSLIVPVPLHWRRLLARKYNQASELGRQLAARTGARMLPDALHRITATPALKGMTRAEREAVMAGVLAINPERAGEIAGADVVLVDDVLTTGATLSAATNACRDAGAATVNVLTVARVSFAE